MHFRLSAFIALLAFSLTLQAKPVTDVITEEQQAAKTPNLVLQNLIEGNHRFITGKPYQRNYLAQVKKSAAKQHPMAIILSCIDSRTPPEIIFDQGIGDIFVTRTAGNVIDTDILGGMEFATKLTGAKLIVVVGHTNCGAIKGACSDVKLGNLTHLLAKIQPSVSRVATDADKKDCHNPAFINHITEANVNIVTNQIKAQSPVIADLIKNGQLQIVGAMQDLTTGRVTFMTDGK